MAPDRLQAAVVAAASAGTAVVIDLDRPKPRDRAFGVELFGATELGPDNVGAPGLTTLCGDGWLPLRLLRRPVGMISPGAPPLRYPAVPPR